MRKLPTSLRTIARKCADPARRCEPQNGTTHCTPYSGHIVDVLGGEFAEKQVLPWEVSQARDEIAYQAYAATHDGAFQVCVLCNGYALISSCIPPAPSSLLPRAFRLWVETNPNRQTRINCVGAPFILRF